MASMSSEEKIPRSLMSRNKGDYKVVSGGRSIKHHRISDWPGIATWPVNPDGDLDPNPPLKRQKKNKSAAADNSGYRRATGNPGAATGTTGCVGDGGGQVGVHVGHAGHTGGHR